MTIDQFRALLSNTDLFVYERSVDEAENTVAALVRRGLEKLLAVAGERAETFAGTEENGLKLCPLTNENAKALMALFPYTKPASHKGHQFTMGFGDRLGLATPGHIRALGDHDIYPVLAQQSIRELNLTHRTFGDVISAAAFNVFQEGYKKGYGADGDHLKTKDEIQYALESGCTMVTLDCSEHIHQQAVTFPQEGIDALYAQLPEAVRAHYEGVYLDKTLPVIGALSAEELRRIVIVFHEGIEHAVDRRIADPSELLEDDLQYAAWFSTVIDRDTGKPLDVFEHEEARARLIHHADVLHEQGSARIVYTEPSSGRGERLTWRAAAEQKRLAGFQSGSLQDLSGADTAYIPCHGGLPVSEHGVVARTVKILADLKYNFGFFESEIQTHCAGEK